MIARGVVSSLLNAPSARLVRDGPQLADARRAPEPPELGRSRARATAPPRAAGTARPQERQRPTQPAGARPEIRQDRRISAYYHLSLIRDVMLTRTNPTPETRHWQHVWPFAPLPYFFSQMIKARFSF